MSIEITFAGHSAVLIKTEDPTIGIDPWLMTSPVCPENLKNPEALDVIILTHGHADHAGDAVILAKQYGSKICATFELAMLMIKAGVPEANVVPMNKGGTVEIAGCSVTLTNAYHSNSYDTPEGTAYAGEACGAIVGIDGLNIYHAGDTCLFSDMALIGKRYSPEIAFLPIGDRFTMGPEEAAEAVKLIACKQVIPIHYKTFDMLTGTAEAFREACSGVDVDVNELSPGDSFSV